MVDPNAPYSELSPEAVLDALEARGLHCDGRVLALNSYENRVYQIGIEDAEPVVAKFYRPGRWGDAAIEIEAVRLATINKVLGLVTDNGGALDERLGRATQPYQLAVVSPACLTAACSSSARSRCCNVSLQWTTRSGRPFTV